MPLFHCGTFRPTVHIQPAGLSGVSERSLDHVENLPQLRLVHGSEPEDYPVPYCRAT